MNEVPERFLLMIPPLLSPPPCVGASAPVEPVAAGLLASLVPMPSDAAADLSLPVSISAGAARSRADLVATMLVAGARHHVAEADWQRADGRMGLAAETEAGFGTDPVMNLRQAAALLLAASDVVAEARAEILAAMSLSPGGLETDGHGE